MIAQILLHLGALFIADTPPSMLEEAKELSRQFAQEISQLPPPPRTRQTYEVLKNGSVWLLVDLLQTPSSTEESALAYWSSPRLWDLLTDIGFNTLYLKGLKTSSPSGDLYSRTSLTLDPRWGGEEAYALFHQHATHKQFFLVGDLIRRSTGLSSDFLWALQNKQDYPSLYHMVEIAPSDWSLLPVVPEGASYINVPWLSLQALTKKGYVPTETSPYTKRSHWNTTAAIPGVDERLHRWIYLQDFGHAPLLSWLAPSFTSEQIAAGDSLSSFYKLGQTILDIDGSIPLHAKETLALWIRKLGGYSVEEPSGGLAALKLLRSDFAYDTLTRAALLHALLTEDAEVLQLIYRLFLQEHIQPMSFVHCLQPFNQFTHEWTEFLSNPSATFRYQEEIVTGALLRQRLLKADMAKLGPKEEVPFSTWAGLSASRLAISDYERGKDKIQEAHLLLAFFYAMQPGIFALSPSDLLGALPSHTTGTLDLLGNRSTLPTLYPSLPIQLQQTDSFATTLRRWMQLRNQLDLSQAELLEVLPSRSPKLILLLHKLPTGLLQLTAINFGNEAIQEIIAYPSFVNHALIDLITGLQVPKILSSPQCILELPALTGKALLFQPKLYSDPPGTPPAIVPDDP